jgi:hypothetical protein
MLAAMGDRIGRFAELNESARRAFLINRGREEHPTTGVAADRNLRDGGSPH